MRSTIFAQRSRQPNLTRDFCNPCLTGLFYPHRTESGSQLLKSYKLFRISIEDFKDNYYDHQTKKRRKTQIPDLHDGKPKFGNGH